MIAEGFAKDEFEARGLILSGNVLVNDLPVVKEGALVESSSLIRVRGQKEYVARSAYKLLYALDDFSVNVEGAMAMDVGSSTGGFTEVLLERGAREVIALDVGTNQLDFRLRQDPRVHVHEQLHICEAKPEDFPYQPDFFTIDVSFISLRQVLPCLKKLLSCKARGIVLFKPQFEIGKEDTSYLIDGVLQSEQKREELVKNFGQYLKEAEFSAIRHSPARLRGTSGNQEEVFTIEWNC